MMDENKIIQAVEKAMNEIVLKQQLEIARLQGIITKINRSLQKAWHETDKANQDQFAMLLGLLDITLELHEDD